MLHKYMIESDCSMIFKSNLRHRRVFKFTVHRFMLEFDLTMISKSKLRHRYVYNLLFTDLGLSLTLHYFVKLEPDTTVCTN